MREKELTNLRLNLFPLALRNLSLPHDEPLLDMSNLPRTSRSLPNINWDPRPHPTLTLVCQPVSLVKGLARRDSTPLFPVSASVFLTGSSEQDAAHPVPRIT